MIFIQFGIILFTTPILLVGSQNIIVRFMSSFIKHLSILIISTVFYNYLCNECIISEKERYKLNNEPIKSVVIIKRKNNDSDQYNQNNDIIINSYYKKILKKDNSNTCHSKNECENNIKVLSKQSLSSSENIKKDLNSKNNDTTTNTKTNINSFYNILKTTSSIVIISFFVFAIILFVSGLFIALEFDENNETKNYILNTNNKWMFNDPYNKYNLAFYFFFFFYFILITRKGSYLWSTKGILRISYCIYYSSVILMTLTIIPNVSFTK